MNSEKVFVARKGNFCLLANLINYMDYHGLQCNEEWLCGIIGYVGFYYTSLNIPSKEIVHGRSGSFRSLFERLQKQLAHEFQSYRISTDISLINDLEELLDRLNTVLIWIDDYYLDYSPYFRLSHYESLVVLLNIEGEYARIFDNEIHTVPIDVFLEAVSYNGWVEVYFSESQLQWKNSKSASVAKGLRWSIDCFYSGNNSDNEFYGFEGMARFSDAVAACGNVDEINNFYVQLNRPGGLSVTRQYLCRFLEMMNKSWSIPDIQESILLYSDLSEKWRKIGNLLFRLSQNPDSDLRDRILKRISEAVGLEREGINKLNKLVMHLEACIRQ